MSNFWGPFFYVFMDKNKFSIFLKIFYWPTEKLQSIKVKKINGSTRTKILWSVLSLLLLWYKPHCKYLQFLIVSTFHCNLAVQFTFFAMYSPM